MSASGWVAAIVVIRSWPEVLRTFVPVMVITWVPLLAPRTSAVRPGSTIDTGSGASAATASRATTSAAQTARVRVRGLRRAAGTENGMG